MGVTMMAVGKTLAACLPVADNSEACATVTGILAQAVRQHGARPFLEVVGSVSETYAQTARRVDELAMRLYGLGVRPGHRILSMLANTHAAVHAWLAANRLNAVDVGINTGYKGQSLEHAVNLSEAEVLLTTSNYLPVILRSAGRLTCLRTIVLLDDANNAEDAVSPQQIRVMRYPELVPAPADEALAHAAVPSDVASIIYTSGTSGPAKGVMLAHAQIALLARRTAEKMEMRAEDVFFSFYPMYHMAGKFMSVLATMVAGGKIVLDSSFVPEQWMDRIRSHGATLTAAHGPMLEMVYALPPAASDRDHKLRLIRTAPFPKRIAADFQERFGVRGMEVWGMTEIGIACWTDPREPLRVGSCGRVDTEYFEFAVLDPDSDRSLPAGQVGEFAVRPRQPWTTMQGYLGMPEKTLQAWRNLWFHTGDCGYIDAAGYVYFVDRAKERIRRRAENISAGDIEAAALQHPDVKEAAAAGVDSGFEGDDDILLCIVTRSGDALDPLAFLRFLMRELPHFMVPRFLRQMQELPRTPTGKLQRAVLKGTVGATDIWDRKLAGVALRDLLVERPASEAERASPRMQDAL